MIGGMQENGEISVVLKMYVVRIYGHETSPNNFNIGPFFSSCCYSVIKTRSSIYFEACAVKFENDMDIRKGVQDI